jgi:hypothetical protein
MLKGLLSGLIWGALVSTLVVVGASLNAPLLGPRAEPVEVPRGSGFDAAMVAPGMRTPGTADPIAPGTEAAPRAEVPEAPETPGGADTAPAPGVRLPEVPEGPVLPETPEASADPVEVARAETAPDVPVAPPAAPLLRDAPEGLPVTEGVDVAPEPVAEPAPVAEPEPEPVATEGEEAAPTPAEVARAGVVTGRLPSIGTETPAAPEAVAAEPATQAEGALERNALRLPLSPGLPVYSIVLIDRTGDALPQAAVAGFPAPLTVALDPRTSGAAAAAEGYRATGHEVLVLADALPAEATPSELSALMADLLAALPSAVGVLIPPESPILRDRARMTAVTGLLARTGHGLVALPQGLDTLGQVAEAAGVPEAKLFSVLDSGDEAAPLIERYLDRAAFEADRAAAVAVLGTVRPETVEALTNWIGGRRAAGMAVAPISALMLDEF